VVGAANALPEDPALAAFADRFLARVFVDPVPDARLEELLETGWRAGRPDVLESLSGAALSGSVPSGSGVSDSGVSGSGNSGSGNSGSVGPGAAGGLLGAVDRLAATARDCDLSAVQPSIGVAVRRMRGAGIALSDRRAIRSSGWWPRPPRWTVGPPRRSPICGCCRW
jgi:MoxR-like ATPase